MSAPVEILFLKEGWIERSDSTTKPARADPSLLGWMRGLTMSWEERERSTSWGFLRQATVREGRRIAWTAHND